MNLLKLCVIVFLLLISYVSCHSSKRDNDLEEAKRFLSLLKIGDYSEIRAQLHNPQLLDHNFESQVDVAKLILNKYSLPNDSAVIQESVPEMQGIKYSFYFHKAISKTDPVKEVRIDVWVSKHPEVKQPILLMYVEYIDFTKLWNDSRQQKNE